MICPRFAVLTAASLLVGLVICHDDNNDAYAATVVETSTIFLNLEDYNRHCQAFCESGLAGVPLFKIDNQPCPTCDGQISKPQYVTYTHAGTATTPYTETRTPVRPGASTPVIVYTPPGKPPTAVTITRPGTKSAPYTETKPPSKPGDPTTYIIHTPPGGHPGIYTKTYPYTGSTTSYSTGTPKVPGGSTPVYEYVPTSRVTPGYYTRIIPYSGGSTSYSTGKPRVPGGSIPIYEYVPGTSQIPSAKPPSAKPSIPKPSSPAPSSPKPSSSKPSSSKPSSSKPSSSKPSSSKPSSSMAASSGCPKPTCATGIDRALYDNKFGNQDGFDDRFETDYYRTTKPPGNKIDTVQSLDDVSSSKNQDAAKNNNLSYEFRAWLYACESGTYKFKINGADDEAIGWFGSRACGNWNKDNADIQASYKKGVKNGSYSKDLKSGDYFPVRIVYANAGGPASFDLTVTGPGGKTLNGDYFVPQPCDGSNNFTPFGQEKSDGSCMRPVSS